MSWDRGADTVEKQFYCRFLPDEWMTAWRGTICPLLPFEPTDYEVCARDSMFRIIMGSYSGGNYLCVPNWNIGVDIADPDDCFWNFGRLTSAYPDLNRVDATSIINAVSAIKHYNN